MRLAFFLGKKPLRIPEPGQKVRLRTRRGLWRGSFRAISEPYTDAAGEVVIRVAKEEEYHEAKREGRRAGSMLWPAQQMEVIPPSEGADVEATQDLSEALESVVEEPEKAEPRPATGGAQEGAQRPWWRRVFRG